ncbi:MAG TPA: hypothetical protein PLF96_11265 [Thermotogota bacterium]|nr:hypothetical protein [Thermotogota bacterium]
MIWKELILMARSKKYNAFCVGGIDVNSRKWVRPVSGDSDVKGSIKEEHMRTVDGRVCQVLDRVRIPFIEKANHSFQTENWLVDPTKRWEWVEKVSLSSLMPRLKAFPRGPLFFNTGRLVSASQLKGIPERSRYSLALVKPPELRIKTFTNSWGKPKCRGDFSFRETEYKDISITDMEFRKKHPGVGEHILKNPVLVLSLGEEYPDNDPGFGNHYKLIASILEN